MTSLLLWLVAQSPPAGFDWGSLVGGALGGSPAAIVLAWWVHELRAEVKQLHAENSANQDKTLALAERSLPALVEATRTLAEVRTAMDAVKGVQPTELGAVLRRLEGLTDDLARRQGPRRDTR